MQEQFQDQQVQTPVKRKKIFRYIFIGLLSFILFILLAAVSIPLLFEDSIKRLFINELNKSLTTEVVIDEDDIDLTLLRNFPDASVLFRNVAIKESIENSDKYFLEASQVSLLFNIRNIIKGKYEIKKVIIGDAKVFLHSDKNGIINYKFWKDAEPETSPSELSILLKEVECSNVNFIYEDLKLKQFIDLNIHTAQLSGNLSSTNYLLNIKADVFSNIISIQSVNYLEKKECSVKSAIQIDQTSDTYTFKDGEFNVEKSKFDVSGIIQNKKDLGLDLKINSSNADIGTLLLLLPAQYIKSFNGVQSKGKIDFQATVKGISSNTQNPAMKIDFALHNVSMYHQQFKDKLENVNCKGYYTNGEKRSAETSQIAIQNLSAQYHQKPLKFSLLYSNFSNPVVDCKLNGTIPASLFIGASHDFSKVNGAFQFDNILLKGNIKSLKSGSGLQNVVGSVKAENIACTYKNEEFILQSGEADLQMQELSLRNIKGSFLGSQFNADIILSNWIEKLFLTEKNNLYPLNIQGKVALETVDAERLMKMNNTSSEEEGITNTKNSNKESALPRISGKIDLQITDFIYQKINFNNISTQIKLAPGFIGIASLKGNGMGGSFNVQSSIRQLATGNYLLDVLGMLNNCNIGKVFESFNSFGQTTLTEKNIQGNITAYLENMSMQFDKHFNVIEPSIYVFTNIKLENGALINYKPLESLSKFIDISELQNVKFSTMQNQIEIKDSKVYIPAMEIKSSALDIYLSGTHTFKNEIDYQLKLSLADLMANKFFGKKNKNTDAYEEVDGGVNIYVAITGTVDKPQIQYNKKEAKQKLQETQEEKPTFLDIFKPDDEEQKIFQKQQKETHQTPSDTLEFIDWEDE